MRKIYLLCFFVVAVITTNAQWTSVYNTDNADFFNLQFFNGESGYIVGGTAAEPYVLKTTNGGDLWTNKVSGIDNAVGTKVNTIAFSNVDTGFVTINGGKLYKTTNAADTWLEIIPEAGVSIFGVIYAGNYGGNDVFYSYGFQNLYKTTNYGDTWTNVHSPAFYLFYQVCETNGNGIEFYNENEAYFVYNSDLEVYKFDGSIAYSVHEFSNSSSQACIDVLSQSLLFASSGTRFVKINDPGESFQITNNLTAALYINDLDFLNENIGFGVNTQGKIFKLTLGGYTNTEEYDGTSQLNSVYIADDSTVYAVGANGEVLKRTGNLLASINDVETQNEISIYPNPSNGIFTIELSDQYVNDAKYTIYNSLGEVIETSNMSGETSIIDLRMQPTGVYFLNVLNNGHLSSKKIIINK